MINVPKTNKVNFAARTKTASRSKTTKSLTVLSTLSLSLVPAFVSSPAASADPISIAKAQAASIAAKITSLNNQIASYAEQYDQAQLQLQNLNKAIQDQQAKIAKTQANIATLKHKLAVEAINFYTQGGAIVSFSDMITGTSTDVTLRKVFAGTVANSQQTLISEFKASTTALDQQKAALATQQSQVTTNLNTAAQSKKDAQIATSQAQAQLSSVNSSIASLIAQAQQREALARQQRIQQLVLAQRAAAAQQYAARQAAQQNNNANGPMPIIVAGGGSEGVVSLAMHEIGKAYVFGASGPNVFDCSGFTMYVWGHFGVSLPHSAAAQYNSITHVPLSQLAPGDLVFYYTPIDHVAIYIGGGRVVVADNPSYPIEVRSLYWDGMPVGAGRP